VTRVLINAFSALQGGGQTYILNLIRGTDQGRQIHFFLTVTPQNRPVFEGLPNTTLITSAFAGKSLIHRFLWENFYLPLVLVRQKIHILLAPAGILPKFYLPSTCRYITICQNMLPFSPVELARSPSLTFRLKFKILYYSQLFSFRRSDLVIFISQYAQQTITPLLSSRVKAVVIPHGIPEVFRRPTNEIAPFAFPYVLYVSSFFEYKAQLEVIEAWMRFRKDHPGSEKLVLLGYDKTAYGEKVRQRIAALGLADQIVMLSSIPYEKLPAYYQHAQVLIFASSCENCPNILLESLASGRPVLSSNFPPMPEFAKEAVLYFDPYQPNELVQRLREILGNSALQDRLGSQGRQLGLAYTAEKSVSETWKSVLNELS
jgi:glycosyltransferase involved in cell wall biosynthesis